MMPILRRCLPESCFHIWYKLCQRLRDHADPIHLTSFITAVFLSRFLLGLLVESRWLDRKKAGLGCAKRHFGYQKDRRNTEPPNPFSKWDFVGKRKWFFAFRAFFWPLVLSSCLCLS
ncbi:hypothetical protein PO124_20900 [Bacillus licheniformis]|nr:hypothetical protein [Bacillus licheniformis]